MVVDIVSSDYPNLSAITDVNHRKIGQLALDTQIIVGRAIVETSQVIVLTDEPNHQIHILAFIATIDPSKGNPGRLEYSTVGSNAHPVCGIDAVDSDIESVLRNIDLVERILVVGSTVVGQRTALRVLTIRRLIKRDRTVGTGLDIDEDRLVWRIAYWRACKNPFPTARLRSAIRFCSMELEIVGADRAAKSPTSAMTIISSTREKPRGARPPIVRAMIDLLLSIDIARIQ